MFEEWCEEFNKDPSSESGFANFAANLVNALAINRDAEVPFWAGPNEYFDQDLSNGVPYFLGGALDPEVRRSMPVCVHTRASLLGSAQRPFTRCALNCTIR